MMKQLEPLLPAIVFAAFVSLLGPWWTVFELDPDEGFNLMKAVLVADGHAMYTEVWSDQPPVLTYILAAVHAAFGTSIGAARATVLVFAAALIASLYFIVRSDYGRLGAWISVAVLCGGFLFQSLSVSVMIGLPAVALGMISLAVLWRDDADQSHVLIVSGVAMALALQTKLFVATMIPAALLAALLSGPADDVSGRRAARAAVWIGSVLLTWSAVSVASGLDPLTHLISPHTQDSIREAFTYDGGPARLWSLLSQQPHYLILAAGGLIVVVRHAPLRAWASLVWLVCATAALIDHRPLWPHQLMLLFVPLAWLSGGLGQALLCPVADTPWDKVRFALAALGVVALVPLAGISTNRTIDRLSAPTDPVDTAAVAALSKNAERTRWIVTDKPLDAYYAGLKTPPELAVVSLKRVKGGTLTPDEVLAVVETIKPEQISYRRMFMGKPVLAFLKANYVQVPGTKRQALFVVPALAE